MMERAQQIRRVSRIIRHYRYNPRRNFESDIALIQVTPNLVLNSYVRPVCLPSSYPPTYRSVTLTGWGATQSKQHSVHCLYI